jgi:hypothetical protein
VEIVVVGAASPPYPKNVNSTLVLLGIEATSKCAGSSIMIVCPTAIQLDTPTEAVTFAPIAGMLKSAVVNVKALMPSDPSAPSAPASP